MAPTVKKQRSLEELLREESGMRKLRFAGTTKSPSKRPPPVTRPRKSSRNRSRTIPNRPSSPIMVNSGSREDDSSEDETVGKVVLAAKVGEQTTPKRFRTFKGQFPRGPVRTSPRRTLNQQQNNSPQQPSTDLPQPNTSRALNQQLNISPQQPTVRSPNSSSSSPQQVEPAAEQQPHSTRSLSSMTPLSIVPVPNTGETSQQCEATQAAGYKSIHCRKNDNEDKSSDPKKKRRGVVKGAKLVAAMSKNEGRLKLQKGVNGEPLPDDWRNLLVHLIGSVVKTHVPMKAASLGDIGEDNWNIVLRHVTVNKNDKWLEAYIFDRAADRFRGLKSTCKTHYTTHGDAIPLEFKDKPDEWQWLVNHFKDPRFLKLSLSNTVARNNINIINHHSGKKLYTQRAREYMKKGNKAAMITTIQEVYEKDVNGAKIAEKLKQKMVEMHEGESDIDSLGESMSVTEQLKLIQEVGGRTKGKRVASNLRKPPLPTGGTIGKNKGLP